jgi:O-antigen ligase
LSPQSKGLAPRESQRSSREWPTLRALELPNDLPPVLTAGALSRTPTYAASLGRGAFIALGASIPVSTFGDSVLACAILLAWLASMRFRETADAIRGNRVAMVACAWVLLHALGALYSIGTPAEVWRAVNKASTFLLVPIAVVMLRDDRDVRLAHYAFLWAIGVTVMLSYFRWVGVIPRNMPLLTDAGYSASVVFKKHLTQNLLLAFGAFVFAVYARLATEPRARLLFAGCAAVTAINVIVVGDGRTGQVVLMVLALYYCIWWAGAKGCAVGLAGIVLVGLVAYAIPGSSLHKRAALAISDAEQWQPGTRDEPSGVKERLEFQRRALQMLTVHPLIGVGTGGYPAADREAASRQGMPATNHPHNEYLLRAVELGVSGIVLLVALFSIQWHEARHLADPAHAALARGLVLMYACGSFGSSMLNDHTETLLFVWMTASLFHGLKTRTTAST